MFLLHCTLRTRVWSSHPDWKPPLLHIYFLKGKSHCPLCFDHTDLINLDCLCLFFPPNICFSYQLNLSLRDLYTSWLIMLLQHQISLLLTYQFIWQVTCWWAKCKQPVKHTQNFRVAIVSLPTCTNSIVEIYPVSQICTDCWQQRTCDLKSQSVSQKQTSGTTSDMVKSPNNSFPLFAR